MLTPAPCNLTSRSPNHHTRLTSTERLTPSTLRDQNSACHTERGAASTINAHSRSSNRCPRFEDFWFVTSRHGRTEKLMFFYFLGHFTEYLLILIVIVLFLFAVGFAFGTVEIHNAMMTCFHCGRETPVGRKTCRWCDKELQ